MSTNPVGRPQFPWTPELIHDLEDLILTGTGINKALEQLNIPSATFYRKRCYDAEFESRISRAQETAQECEVDKMLELADSADVENVDVIRLQIWARQWVAAKRKPKKYGKNETHEHNHSMNVSVQLASSQAPKEIEGSAKARLVSDGHVSDGNK